MIDRVPKILAFSLCYSFSANCKAVSDCGRCCFGGYNHFLSPGGCILSLGASLCLACGCSACVCVCVFVRVHASFWAIWCSPDLHWWEQGKTSGCTHWQHLLITLTTGPEWHHHRAVTVICAGRQRDVNRIKEKAAERWYWSVYKPKRYSDLLLKSE